MGMRIPGLASGMDTESMVQELVKANRIKIDNVEKQKTKLEWKKEAWTDLNKKIYDFHTGPLSKIKTQGSYKNKKVTVSDETKASITGDIDSINGNQELKINELASSTFLTGSALPGIGSVNGVGGTPLSSATKISDMDINLVGQKLKVNGKDVTFGADTEITADTTIGDLVKGLQNSGINANFDANQQRFFLSSKESGASSKNDLDLSEGTALIQALGLDRNAGGKYVAGKDAEIEYNGATLTSSTNVVKVNGLTINLKGVTAATEPIQISVATDVDKVYTMVKDFIKSYNDLVEELSTKYKAPAAKDYEPLTEDEKAAMSDKQVELWEKRIKDSLLRRDDSVNNIMSKMRNDLLGSVSVTGKDGVAKNYSLSSLGIVTGPYTENGKLHINGESSESSTYSGEDNILRSLLEDDPEVVMKTLSELTGNMYKNIAEEMKSVKNTRSAFTVYNDQLMDKEIKEYKIKIADMEKKLASLENRYYRQFAAMESAMAKMNSQGSALTGMMGG